MQKYVHILQKMKSIFLIFANLKKDFKEVCDEMDVLGKEIGVTIHCQREEIFEKMHRL